MYWSNALIKLPGLHNSRINTCATAISFGGMAFIAAVQFVVAGLELDGS